MTRYEVSVHAFGRPIVQKGPAAGCADFPQHKWTRITPRPLGLQAAQKLADAQTHHAVVCVWMSSQRVYDNGKEPFLPEGWIAERTIE